MGESRDANDPRDAMRAMRKEARAEFERDEADDTGGQEHASRADREGIPAPRREPGEGTGSARSTREQSDEDTLRAPRGDPSSGGGGNQAGGPPREHGVEPGEE